MLLINYIKISYLKLLKHVKRKKSKEKIACIKDYTIKALKAQLSELKKHISLCNKSKNPNKCKSNIKTKIKKDRKENKKSKK